jgi:predicted alpha/beta-hydrolase family hydrolase
VSTPINSSDWAVPMRETIQTPTGDAWADIDRPRGKSRALLLIGHGAGGSVDSPDLLAVRDSCLAAAITVARITQPYRVAGRRAPAAAPRLDEAWIAATAQVRSLRGLARLPSIHAGRSSGARVACRTAAATGAAAVIALAFPLHPPGRPDKSRLAELELPTVPVLVVQGDRDPFGCPPAAPQRSVVLIAGADHSLKKDLHAIGVAVVEFVTTMIEDAKVK